MKKLIMREAFISFITLTLFFEFFAIICYSWNLNAIITAITITVILTIVVIIALPGTLSIAITNALTAIAFAVFLIKTGIIGITVIAGISFILTFIITSFAVIKHIKENNLSEKNVLISLAIEFLVISIPIFLFFSKKGVII